jgi:hypothetical protein
VQEKALGLKVSEGLNPSQAFIKLVETELTEIIGGENKTLDLRAQPPAVFTCRVLKLLARRSVKLSNIFSINSVKVSYYSALFSFKK